MASTIYNDPLKATPVPGAITADNVTTQGNAINPADAYGTINSSSLNATTPVTLPTPTPSVNPAIPIISTAQANVDAQKQAEANVAKETASLQPLQNERQSFLDKVGGLFGNITTAQTNRSTAETAIDPYRKDLADINKQIADVTVAYRGEKDAVSGNGSITKEAQNGLLDNVNSKYGRQLADLAIRQSAANQNVSALETAADRKLALTLAPLQTEISYYKDYLLANNKDLTDQEKEKINLIISEKDKLITQHTAESNIANTALKTALESGVKIPDSTVSKILANPSQTYQILAGDGISLAKPTATGGGTYTPGANPIVDSWITNVLNGNSTMQQVPANIRNSVSVGLTQQPQSSYSPLAASRFTTAATKIAANFIKLPQYELTANGLPYLQRIDAAIKTPGSVSDQDLLDSLTKLNTAGNAVTDAQVKVITEGKSFADTMSVFKNKFKNGGVLSDNQRSQIQSIAQAIYDNYKKGYQPVYNQVTSQLKTAGIPEAFWTIPNLNNLGGDYTIGQDTTNSTFTSGSVYNGINLPN